MQRLIRWWAAAVVKGRWVVITCALLLAGLAVIPMGNLYYDNANERFFVEGDPNLKAFNKLLDLFDDIEYLSIGLAAPEGDKDVFTADTVAVIDELTRFLEEQPQVTQVRSLSKYEYTHSDGPMMATDPVIDQLDDPASLAEGRRIIREQPMALGSLITEDLQHTRIAARIRYVPNTSDHKVALMGQVREFISEQNYAERGYQLRLSGNPVFDEQFQVLTQKDQSWINPAMAVVMIVILFFSFRSVSGMLLPWLVIATSIMYVTGFQGLMVWPHSVVESALIPALIIIGIGISVHVLVTFYHLRADGHAPRQAAEQTIIHLWVPAFYTALTTAAGFLALGVTELVPVRQFAWLGAIGAMTLFVVAMTLLPAVLSFIKPFSPRTQRTVSTGVIARATATLAPLTYRWRRPLLLLGGALLGASLWLVPQLEIDTNFITYFKADNPTRQDLQYFDKHYNGIQNIDVIIDSGEEGGIHNPDFLQRVDSLQQWLESLQQTGAINSLVDFHKEINKALHFDDPKWYTLPDSKEMAAQFLLLYDNTGPNEDLTDAKDFYERYVRLAVPIQNMAASETSELLDTIKGELAQNYPDLAVTLTGSLVMYNAQDQYVNRGMARSFLIALGIIGLSFVVLFRSVKYGLIALVPSIVPILMTGAILVLAGIALNLGTMIVGAMTMGIAVDDAIHVMNGYLRAKRAGRTTLASVHKTLTESGRAVVFTSIVLVCGFSMMLFGSFIPYIYTGLFAATVMALALLGDLLFLPALLHAVDTDRQTDSDPQITEELTTP